VIQIKGKVIKGDGYGRVLGLPTANLDRRDFLRRKLRVKFGIYGGDAEFKLKAKSYKLKAAIVIGPWTKEACPR